MKEHIVGVRFDYEVEILRRRCRIPEQQRFFAHEPFGVREVSVEDAPIAYRIFRIWEGTATRSFEVRSFEGRFWWPVNRDLEPLTPEAFSSLAATGDKGIVGALGVPSLYARETLDDFAERVLIRQSGKSTFKDRKRALEYGVAGTLFCGDRVYFEGGPPAFFRGPCSNTMEVGPCGLEPGRHENQSFENCRIEGPAQHYRRWSAGTGQALGIEEIDTWREGMPGWSVLADVAHDIEVTPHSAKPGAAALFCEREFVAELRASLGSDGDAALSDLLRRHDAQLLNSIRSSEIHSSDRRILRRFAEIQEPELDIPFHGRIKAARTILKRLKFHGLATDLDEIDDAALGCLS